MRFTKKEENNGFHVVTCGLNNISKEAKRSINLMFYQLENFKNEFVEYVNKKIEDIINSDEELIEIQKRIDFFHKTEGKVTKESEKRKELRDLYIKRNQKILKNENYNSLKWMNNFIKETNPEYKIYLHDDIRSQGCKDIIFSLEKYLKGEGKNIHTKKHGNATSLSSKCYFQPNGKTRSTAIQFEFENEKMYALIFDLSPEYVEKAREVLKEKGRVPTHKFLKIEVYINKSDPLQSQILKSPQYGQSKLTRVWKRGSWKNDGWKYQIQISIKNQSTKMEDIVPQQGVKVAVDYGTETAAIVCSNGYVEIVEIAPDSPRVTEKIRQIDMALSRSSMVSNQKLIKSNGVFMKKKEAKENGLSYVFSNNYRKLLRYKKAEHGKLKRKRKFDNLNTAKHIASLGDEQVTERNHIRSWKQKLCRMNKIAREIYDNKVRTNNYCCQIQDRAVAQIPARIKHICEEKNLSYKEISGLNLSTYNHFSQANDLFLHLNDRLIVSEKYFLKNKDKFKVEDFSKTFQTIEFNGKQYVLQRDLYSAAKMLYCYSKIERKKDKNGKIREFEVWFFDNKGFTEFFDNIFYPNQEKYLKEKFKDLLNGEKMSGTIFGIQ